MSSLSLSGLASGVDTNSIVSQLMALERQATTKYTSKQTKVTAEQNVLKGIASKLTALKSAADALKKDGTAWNTTQTVESSDSARVAVAKTSGAGAGGHSITVDRLASSAQRGFAIGDLTAGGSITVGTSTFTFGEKATIGDIVSQINAKADSPVYAAVVKNANNEDRLVLSARTTGENSRFTVTSAQLTEDVAYESPAGTLNAIYHLDGGAATPSQTNVLDNAIPGLRLTLKGVTSSPASIVVGAPDLDRSAVKTKIKAVVDAYNALVDTTRTALNEKPVANAATNSDLGKGTLFGDTGLNTLLTSFRNDLRDTIGGLTGIDDLGDLGIDVPKTTGGASSADAKAGRFSIDDAKLTDALAADWTKVSAFMDSFAAKVDKMVDAQTGKTGSLLDARVASGDRQQKRLTASLTSLNERLDQREKRLKAQFAAMELAMQNSQAQGNWLSGQIAALNR